MREIDFLIWDLKQGFTVIEAACLWYGINPYTYPHNDIAKDASGNIRALSDVLTEKALQGQIKGSVISLNPKGAREPKTVLQISREGLKEFAFKIGQKPLFLFSEERGKEFDPVETKKLPFKHSPDFCSIALSDGKVLALTTQQAQVIEILYNAYTAGTPDVSGAYIFERIGTAIAEMNLKKAFFKRDKEIYEALIESKKKGSYRLKVK